jgi:glycosyltransferase involved in cell wall biosynthesis
MKIAIGMNIQEGAFGGGNQFGKLLAEHLQKNGHKVFFDLKQPDLDLILMTDPRKRLRSVAFGPIEILQYVRQINKRVILVQRINECDERKETRGLNKYLSVANKIMDHTVFISSWLEQIHRDQNSFTKESTVIKNGADRSIFFFEQHKQSLNRKIRIVTHHWSANWNKGWDVYTSLDQQLSETSLGERFSFHYIGNTPKEITLRATELQPPTFGTELANQLQQHDIYLSASLNEPAGMHHIEGAACGLPIVFRESGALPEYCAGFGEKFLGPDDVIDALERLVKKFDSYTSALETYPYTAQLMCENYTSLFTSLHSQKERLIKERSHNHPSAFQLWLQSRFIR